jgi:hypothetical protein
MSETPTTKNAAAVALGRLGGGRNTAAQQQARRQNAQRGGRPKRVCLHCGEPVSGGHVDRALDDTCGQHGWRWQQGEDGAPTATGATALLDAIAKVVRQRDLPRTRLRLIAELLRSGGR